MSSRERPSLPGKALGVGQALIPPKLHQLPLGALQGGQGIVGKDGKVKAVKGEILADTGGLPQLKGGSMSTQLQYRWAPSPVMPRSPQRGHSG